MRKMLPLVLLPVVMAFAQDPAPQKAPEEKIVVEVAGAVQHAGVYKHRQGDRVWDAIQSADGVTEKADISDINLAAPLVDATRLFIPEIPVSDGQKTKLSNQAVPGAATLNPPEYTRSGWLRMGANAPKQSTDAAKPGTTQTPAKDSPAANALINLNTASKAELESLPGIGPVTADKIIAYREAQKFQSVEDFQKVPGIGPSKMEAVRKLICVK